MVKAGYKQTEIGEIPEDWETKEIRQVCKLINGRGFKPHEWKRSGLPIIRIQNLNGSDEFNYYDGLYDRKLEVNEGQLLFAWSGSRGTSFGPHVWKGDRGLLNYHTWKVVTDNDAISGGYFLYALRNLTASIEEKAHGASALVHTQKWEMEGYQFPAPKEPAEQKAIAAALSDVDTLIASLEKLIEKKRDIKTATMQQLLTGKKRLPGFQKEWQIKKIEELADIDPENLSSTTNPSYEFRYVSLEDVDSGRLRGHSEQIFSTSPSRARRILRMNDVVIATVRPNLKSHFLFQRNEKDWICSTGFAVIRCNPGKADAHFLFYHFFARQIELQIETLIAGSNYPAINSGDVRKLEINCPEIDEQAAIACVISNMDKELHLLEEKLNKAKAIKQGMMQELLTGRTRLV